MQLEALQLGKLLPRRLVRREVLQNIRVHDLDRLGYFAVLLQPEGKCQYQPWSNQATRLNAGGFVHGDFSLVRQQVRLVCLQNFIVKFAGAIVLLLPCGRPRL